MIFWKYKWFTMDKLPHLKHTSVLLDICHHHTDSHLFSKAFSKLSLNLTMEPFKESIILKIQLFHWRLPSRTQIKNNYYIQLFIFFICSFLTLILKMQSNIRQYYPSFYTFYESHFSRVRHPSHPCRGHVSLTRQMTQCERSDWLMSANFINIMIE